MSVSNAVDWRMAFAIPLNLIAPFGAVDSIVDRLQNV